MRRHLVTLASCYLWGRCTTSRNESHLMKCPCWSENQVSWCLMHHSLKLLWDLWTIHIHLIQVTSNNHPFPKVGTLYLKVTSSWQRCCTGSWCKCRFLEDAGISFFGKLPPTTRISRTHSGTESAMRTQVGKDCRNEFLPYHAGVTEPSVLEMNENDESSATSKVNHWH